MWGPYHRCNGVSQLIVHSLLGLGGMGSAGMINGVVYELFVFEAIGPEPSKPLHNLSFNFVFHLTLHSRHAPPPSRLRTSKIRGCLHLGQVRLAQLQPQGGHEAAGLNLGIWRFHYSGT